MDKKELVILKRTEGYVRERFDGESTGHGWWHADRVRKMAVRIGEREEGADLFVVQLAALLHDIADWKFHSGGDGSAGAREVKEWLEKMQVDEDIISHVCEIMKEVSFKGAGVRSNIRTKEGMVVQDADRLDAMGAIGIARCFATGARMDHPIYEPNTEPRLHETFDEYKAAKTTSVNHFYEKLFLLKDMMNTDAGKRIAEGRHAFMERFLDTLFKEMEGGL